MDPTKEEKLNISVERRSHQMKKELIISLALYLSFFIWWYFSGYFLYEHYPKQAMKPILGLPAWFFLSSVIGYILFALITIFTVRKLFKDFSLNQPLGESQSSLNSEEEISRQNEIEGGGQYE